MTERWFTVTDQNSTALFTAFYGATEGQLRQADTRKHGAARALQLAAARESQRDRTTTNKSSSGRRAGA